MALIDLFSGGEKPNLRSEDLLDVKDIVMGLVGSGQNLKDKNFRETYASLVSKIGMPKADKLLVSILGFNANANNKMNPQQRFDAWSNLSHNDDYVSGINEAFKGQAPMYDMSTSSNEWVQQLAGRSAKPKENKPEMKQQIQNRLAPIVKSK